MDGYRECSVCNSPDGHIPVQELGSGRKGVLCLRCFMERSIHRNDASSTKTVLKKEGDFFKHHASDKASYLMRRISKRDYPSLEFLQQVIRRKHKIPTLMTIFFDYLSDCCSIVDDSLSRYLKTRDLSVRFSYAIIRVLQELPDQLLKSLWNQYPDYHREFALFFPYHFVGCIQFKYDEAFSIREDLVSIDSSDKQELSLLEIKTGVGKEYREQRVRLDVPNYWAYFLWKLADYCVYDNRCCNRPNRDKFVLRELSFCLQDLKGN